MRGGMKLKVVANDVVRVRVDGEGDWRKFLN